jgi:glycosyltransferase involved in cell wall biosynthesis
VIGISLLTINPEAAGGTLTYARELMRALGRVGELEYRVFAPTTVPGAGQGLPTQVVERFPAGRSRPRRVAGLSLAALAPGRLRRALGLGELEAIHFPLGVMIPTVDSPPAATTMHDLQHEVFPEFFSRGQLAYRRLVYGWTMRRSTVVVTDSEHARGTLVERHGLDPGRVRAIHLAVDHERFTPDGRQREPFLLYPANAWPHKNHPRLFQAFALVRRERPELKLLLTGAGHQRLHLPAGVESLGHVPIERLVDLYRTAAALVYPSLYEGFGIPPLEAMACACPAAVSEAASLPEICGQAAVYFDPLEPESIADGIRHVLDSPPAGGPEHAAHYTWERCAHQHDALYRELSRA